MSSQHKSSESHRAGCEAGYAQSAAHDVVLGKHVREAHATGLDLDEDLAFAGQLEVGLLDREGLPRLLEDSVLVRLGKSHRGRISGDGVVRMNVVYAGGTGSVLCLREIML